MLHHSTLSFYFFSTQIPATIASRMNEPGKAPVKISVIVLSYNGKAWLHRCFESLEQQTIFLQIEVILTDNNSADSSVEFTNEWMARTGVHGRVVQNGANLFYCGANNNGAAVAAGEFLLFLNQDAWLERDCLENLYNETLRVVADGASPMVFDYDDNTYQCGGEGGLDLFGVPVGGPPAKCTQETPIAPGCSLYIKKVTFDKIGGFPSELLGYVDEADLCWRVWVAGGKIISVPSARVHHRGAVIVNPKGRSQTLESRTSDSKRFLTNRNNILFLLKNCQHVLLLLLIPHLLLLLAEAGVMLVVVKRWSFIRKAYLAAILDAFKMYAHVRVWRRRIRSFRQRGDFWMMRFLRLKPGRWYEIERIFKFGLPKVDNK
jgi:GT2 family glycosyltransferase